MAIYKLKEICFFNNQKKIKKDDDLFISTENMLPNANGVVNKYINEGRYSFFEAGDTLLSNIRPYFRKVWCSNTNGFASNDVLIFRNKEQVLSKYLFLIISSQDFIDHVMKSVKGTKMPRGNKDAMMDYSVNIPSIIEQKAIIEIIKPFGDIVNNIDKEINLLKNLLISTYNSSDNSLYSLSKYILLNSNKYENQEYYNPTSSVGELRIDNSKIMKISSNRKSRANLTPVKNSFIVSKLLGENKVLFIDNCFDNVVSTGFFNFTTDHYDHLLGFILSEGFKKQKELNSTGTTMLGLTNESFLNLKIKAPVSNGSDVSIYISKLISIRSQAEKVVSLMTDILVK